MEKEKKSAEAGFTFHLFAVNLLEKLVEAFRGIMTSRLLDFCTRWLSRIGHIAIIVAAALGFLFSLIVAIKANSFQAFLLGIAWVLLIFVVQYTANRFLNAGEALIKNNPTQLSSQAFLDCFGFLALVGGMVILILHIVTAIRAGSLEIFLLGLGAFAVLEFLALVAFNAGEVNIRIVKGNSAGQEAIGIITFFIKAVMRLVPIFFGILLVIYTIMLFIAGLRIFGSAAGFAWLHCQYIAKDILSAALIPFLSYIAFALFYLGIDVIKAILSIPEKLDKLEKK